MATLVERLNKDWSFSKRHPWVSGIEKWWDKVFMKKLNKMDSSSRYLLLKDMANDKPSWDDLEDCLNYLVDKCGWHPKVAENKTLSIADYLGDKAAIEGNIERKDNALESYSKLESRIEKLEKALNIK